MGYFDALMSSWFKTLPDGRKLFYPRGAWGRGYIIASEQDYKRLRQQIKVYLIVMVVLMIGASVSPGYLWILGLGVLLLGFYYLVFAPYCVRGLQPSMKTCRCKTAIRTRRSRSVRSACGQWRSARLRLSYWVSSCSLSPLMGGWGRSLSPSFSVSARPFFWGCCFGGGAGAINSKP